MTTKINNEFPNFIGEYQSQNTILMSDIIDFFETNVDLQKEARFGDMVLDKSKKDAIEITINPNQLETDKYSLLKKYFIELQIHFNSYLNDWPFLRTINKFSSGAFHIQKYLPGGHYNAWHTERDCLANCERVLVFMTYLNDIDNGGETEFLHYGKKFKPKTGKTIIWPAEWTHAHKGLPVEQEKFIITGWMGFN